MVAIDLSGKGAVVTGAGRGLGRAVALRLGEAGAGVAVSDLVLADARAVADEIATGGGKAIAVQTDVSDRKQVDALIEKAAETFGSVDIMVNNAGISLVNLFLDTTEDEFDKMLAVNLKGTYYGSQAALGKMVAQGEGKIINMASMAPKVAGELHALYGATKAAIITMTQTIAKEYGRANIKANCVCPGIIKTSMWTNPSGTLAKAAETVGATPEAVWDAQVEAVPLRRAQSEEDIANAVLFLASDLAENISAQALNVNGGQVFH